MINQIPVHQRFRGKPINIDGLTDMTSYIKVCEIFPKNILQIKPERSKKFIYIFTIFLYPLPSQMVGGKLDRLCGLKRPESGVFQIANSDKDDSRAYDHAVCLTCSEECCRATARDRHHSHSHCPM